VCLDKICGNFQHNADYCRIFLVLEHKKGVAQNFNSATAPVGLAERTIQAERPCIEVHHSYEWIFILYSTR